MLNTKLLTAFLCMPLTFILNSYDVQASSESENSAKKKSSVKQEFHDLDPRNTHLSLGLIAYDNGDLKITSNGGFSNSYGNGEYQNLQVFGAEYNTQSERARFRGVNFDERFGGVYVDLVLQDVMNIYTVGYMIPLQAINSKLLFFPSINYTHVDFDTKAAASKVIEHKGDGDSIVIDGVEVSRDTLANIIKDLGLDGHDTSSLGTFNLYSLMPWNTTHYSLAQITAGSSYSGFDMEMVNVYLQQGMRTKVGEQVVLVYLEVEYTDITIQSEEISDTSIGFGVNFKF